MDRTKEKREKGSYFEKLQPEEKKRYAKKLINGIDPYELRGSDSRWSNSKDYQIVPPLDYAKMIKYIVQGVSYYTLDEFLCFKSLEAHMQFEWGWVQDLLLLYVPETENTLIKSQVRI